MYRYVPVPPLDRNGTFPSLDIIIRSVESALHLFSERVDGSQLLEVQPTTVRAVPFL